MNNPNKFIKLVGKSRTNILFSNQNASPIHKITIRHFSLLPILSRVLKLRYLFLGTAVGSGIAIQNVTSYSFIELLNIILKIFLLEI